MNRIAALTLCLSLFCLSAHAGKALFAGGHFWYSEADFEQLDGVLNVVTGFTGGQQQNPAMRPNTSNTQGHYYAIEIDFNPDRISYTELLDYFWKTINPYDPSGQFCNRGDSYRSAIFTMNPQQHSEALASKDRLQQQSGQQLITTPVLAAGAFYPAEASQQNFYRNHPVRYHYQRWLCHRGLPVNTSANRLVP